MWDEIQFDVERQENEVFNSKIETSAWVTLYNSTNQFELLTENFKADKIILLIWIVSMSTENGGGTWKPRNVRKMSHL